MNLRRSFNRFCYKNHNKGIPNLMLYVALGCALVYFMSLFDKSDTLYYVLCFDKQLILEGQFWRLFTYIFIYNGSNPLFTVLILYILYTLGRATEMSIGTLKFNLFFFTGIILQDIFCMVLGTPANANYLIFSMTLIFATQHPDFRFRLYFIIPVKAWVLVLIDLGIIAYNVFALRAFFPHNLYPLISILNVLIFFGDDVINLLPMPLRIRLFKKKPQKQQSIVFTRPEPGPYAAKNIQPYTHRCEVCGRTDVSDPELEFRYCSRCNGYHCYCEEHISNHEHIE